MVLFWSFFFTQKSYHNEHTHFCREMCNIVNTRFLRPFGHIMEIDRGCRRMSGNVIELTCFPRCGAAWFPQEGQQPDLHGRLDSLGVQGTDLSLILGHLGPSWSILGYFGTFGAIFGTDWAIWGHFLPVHQFCPQTDNKFPQSGKQPETKFQSRAPKSGVDFKLHSVLHGGLI